VARDFILLCAPRKCLPRPQKTKEMPREWRPFWDFSMGAACPPIIPANEITAGLADHMAAFRIFIGGLSAATKDQGNAAGTNRRIHLFIHFDPPMNRFVKRIRANRFMGATKNLSRAPRTLTAAYCRIKNGKAADAAKEKYSAGRYYGRHKESLTGAQNINSRILPD